MADRSSPLERVEIVRDTNMVVSHRLPGRREDHFGGYAGIPDVSRRVLEPFAFDQRPSHVPVPVLLPRSDKPMRPSALRLSIGESDPRRRLADDLTDAAANNQLDGCDESGVHLEERAFNFDPRAKDSSDAGDAGEGGGEASQQQQGGDDEGYEKVGPTTYAGAPRVSALTLAARLADLDDLDEWGKTALHYAALRGDADLLATLLERGAMADRRDGGGSTPLHLAIFNRREGVVFTLAQRSDVDVNALDGSGFTPLCIAASLGLNEASRSLLRRGARALGRNANLPTAGHGQIPLHAATRGCHLKIVGMLLTVDRGKHTAEQLAAPNSLGHTALHVACAEEGSFPLVSELLRRGADPAARDREGKTPADTAREAGHPALAEAIDNYGAAASASSSSSSSSSKNPTDARSLDRGQGK